MREIKYRIWDMDRKVMLGTQGVIFYYGDFYESYRDLEDGIVLDNIVVMQYTGLKDKNGVEIYEGDIVRKFSNINKYTDEWASDVEPTYEPSSIVFHEGSFKTTYKGEPSAPLNFTSYTMSNDFEVIGDIYQNKDLI